MDFLQHSVLYTGDILNNCAHAVSPAELLMGQLCTETGVSAALRLCPENDVSAPTTFVLIRGDKLLCGTRMENTVVNARCVSLQRDPETSGSLWFCSALGRDEPVS